MLPAGDGLRHTCPFRKRIEQRLRTRSLAGLGAPPLLLAGLVAVSGAALLLANVLHASTAAVWLYLPLVLLVTSRWGAGKGLILTLAANLLVLTFLVPPLGRPFAFDSPAYARLMMSIFGMVVAVLTVAELNKRRIAVERRGRAEAETLADIGRRISASLDLGEVLRTAAESANRLVAADLTTIALVDSQRRLPLAAVVGNRTPLLPGIVVAANSGSGGKVLASGRPFQKQWAGPDDGVGHDPIAVHALKAEQIRSTLAVPILQGMETVGVFWVHSRAYREFTEGEVALLERLSAQAGAAIANARAHAEVEALLVATAKLGEQAEPEAVLRTLVEEAASLLEAERATYAILRNGLLTVPAELRAGSWCADGHEARPHGLLWSVWESGRPYRTDNVGADPKSNAASVRAHGSRAQLTVPLLTATGENLGVISLNNKRGVEGFSERDERLLTAICETGAAIFMRARDTAARLEAERAASAREREIAGLLRAAERLNATAEPEEVFLGVVGVAAELLAVSFASIVTNEGDHALSRYRWTDGVWQATARRLPLEGSASGWVISHGQTIRSADLTGGGIRGILPSGVNIQRMGPEPEAGPAVKQFSVLSVPIVARAGHVLGALHLYDRRDGLPFTEEDQRLAEGIAHHAAVAMERSKLIEELRLREQHLQRQAVTDPLTGLPNRSLFLDRLGHALASGRRRNHGVAVLFLDLDGFKDVNDSLGHPVGDALLRAVGERLAGSRRGTDTVARFGGDEFAVLLEDVADSAAATEVANGILWELERPFAAGDQPAVFATASIGIAHRGARDAKCSAENLIREADIALYQAKAAGKGQATVFTPSMGTAAVERLELQTDLQRAIADGELCLEYQPLVSLQAMAVLGAEALLRWRHPRRGLLQPDAFIPLSEECGLILPIGRWVLQEACRQAADWQQRGAGDVLFRVAVNLSARQFEQPNLLEQVASTLKESCLPTSALTLEITETAIIRDPGAAIATLASLRQLGVRLAIDDFGTGYSSLSYLEQLGVDMLKIDRSFIARLGRSPATRTIVEATILMAHALKIEVVAEGIETEEQRSILTDLGCDLGQGYLFRRPCLAGELEQFLRTRNGTSSAAVSMRVYG